MRHETGVPQQTNPRGFEKCYGFDMLFQPDDELLTIDRSLQRLERSEDHRALQTGRAIAALIVVRCGHGGKISQATVTTNMQ